MEKHPGPPCLFCGSPDTAFRTTTDDREYKTTPDHFGYYSCSACDVVFIDPVPFQAIHVIYPPNYYSYSSLTESWIFQIKFKLDLRRYRRMLSGVTSKTIALLDVGGGAGYELTCAKAADARVTRTMVVDVDVACGNRARAAGHEYLASSFEDFKPTDRFEGVILANILEHVKDPRMLLAKAFASTAPGGMAIIATPSIEGLDARLFKNRHWGGYHCPRHWILFTKASLEKLAVEVGYRIVEIYYTQAASFWSLSLVFFLEDLGIVRITSQRPAMYHPLFKPLAAFFALLDYARLALGGKTSQMVMLLQRPSVTPDPKCR